MAGVRQRIAYGMSWSTTSASTWKVHVRDQYDEEDDDEDEDEDVSRMIIRLDHVNRLPFTPPPGFVRVMALP